MRPIVRTEEDLQSTTALPSSIKVEDLKKEIILAQEDHLQEVMGEPALSALIDSIYSSEIVSEEMSKAAQYAKDGVICFAVAKAVPQLNIHIGSSGFTVKTSTESEKATYGQVRDYQRHMFQSAQDAFNRLITFLLANASNVTDFEDSEAHNKLRTGLVSNGIEMSEGLPFKVGHFLYLKMRPFLQESADDIAVPILGTDLYDFLVEQKMTSGDFIQDGNEYLSVLILVQKAMSLHALYESFEPLRVQVSDKFYIDYLEDPVSGRTQKNVEDNARYQYLKNLEEKKTKAWSRLSQHLLDNQESYPLWTAPTTAESTARTNTKIYRGHGLPR